MVVRLVWRLIVHTSLNRGCHALSTYVGHICLGTVSQCHGAGDEYIVVHAVLGAEGSPGLALVSQRFVDCHYVALNVGAVAHHPYQIVHNEGLGGSVGVKPGLAVGPTVQVTVVTLQLVEYELSVVAFGAVALQGVTLYYQQGIGIPTSHPCRHPCQYVVVNVAAPLGHQFGPGGIQTVEHGYHRKVAGIAASAYVDSHNVAVLQFNGSVGILPEKQLTVVARLEMYLLERFWTLGLGANKFAYGYRPASTLA